MRLSVAVLLVCACQPALAQQIYKCQSKDGSTSFQQVPCPSSSKTASVRSYTPERDSVTNIRPMPNSRTTSPQSFTGEIGGAAVQPSQQRPEAPSRVPSVAVESPLSERQLRDQYGNKYEERPDSNFVRDKRTGKLCYRWGSRDQFVNCN